MRRALLLLACVALLPGCRPAAPTPTSLVATSSLIPTSGPAAATPSPVATPLARSTPTPSAVPNKRGVHLLLDDGGTRWPADVWAEHVLWAARLVGRGGYVVQLIRSTDLAPELWQPYFDLLAREGLVPIVRLATEKDPLGNWWKAPEPDADGRGGYRDAAERIRQFLAGITWRTDRLIVTVGNEPNRPDEWGGGGDPAP